MRSTIDGGGLAKIENCYIIVPGAGTITLNNLPDISDSKSAAYNDEPIMGRAFPLKTYSHSENRSISFTIHLFNLTSDDIETNLNYLRILESCVYPRASSNGAPFTPPPICKIRCGKLLGDNELCAVLKQYSVKFPTDVVWDEKTYMPMKIDIDTSWEVVYSATNLPGQERIMTLGM